MFAADIGSQIRVGALAATAAGAPPPPAGRSDYAADWNPPAGGSRGAGTNCWPLPSFGGSARSSSPTDCWPIPGGRSGLGREAQRSSAAAPGGGPILYDRAPSPSPTPGVPQPTPSTAPTSPSQPQASPTPSPSPGPAPQPPHIPTPAEIAAQRRELQTAKVDASIAQDVYNDPPKPPAGYHVANDQELARLGLTPEMLEDGRSDFRARVYVGEDGRTVVAFRGSLSKEDWKNDVQQGAGLHSDYYDRAIAIGERVARASQPVTFTGHSLGGGLASAAAIASGGQADTFNAAGITGRTVDQARAANRAMGGDAQGEHVDAYYDGGAPLSKLQDANAVEGGILGGVIGSVLGGPLGGIFGGGLGSDVGHVPSAYGQRHVLATIDPPGGGSITERHGMDYVQRGLDRALSQLH